jgi:cyclic pyranopterin phosphate synthase
MDVGNANEWKSDKLVPKEEMLRSIGSAFPLGDAHESQAGAPARIYPFADGKGDVGVIASVTEPFCSGCTRTRITADGRLVTCLFSETGMDLKRFLRSGAGEDALLDRIRTAWKSRKDRYSEERLAALQSEKGYSAKTRKKIEMITLGG